MARSWLITSRGIAKKIKNATHFSTYQFNDSWVDANLECPNCKHLIDNSDVTLEWPGLPAGVKFDPSDLELLEHLEGKVGSGNSKPHMFIDEFIPTLEENEGICYTHPENLPGIKNDGSNIYFFHRISNAYATGCRKRRKISRNNNSSSEEHVRWHKTGKTKSILENGVRKGWKKIMVLYKGSKRGCKPDKANWVMHQYHLGAEEDEKDGELVVSKIFYQLHTKQTERLDMDSVEEESNVFALRVSPRTPKTNTPQPPRSKKKNQGGVDEDDVRQLQDEEEQYREEHAAPILDLKKKGESAAWWSCESQAVEDPRSLDESLLCHEVLDSFPLEASLHFDYPNLDRAMNGTLDPYAGTAFGSFDLDSIEIGTPPDFQLADFQFGSQESITSWLDRF
ncbi:SUPPRESSOR OF GAMMA RESPONSE 1 isoform X1 [Ananas comosus]|uniref:SUPPRESSOR OF GAMMA RESPONSE 1 isoform X1 n=1 Tax=Ananas comosus TaxID=4615 RepID=A0A6P5H018_ANACO|nr:SUPPRESSOR OF GAMMA RESPONSE 1 isoform X1 [Ananas comosus]